MKVQELMAELAKHPPDADVFIVDADTDWYLALLRVDWERHDGLNSTGRIAPGAVLLSGEYAHPNNPASGAAPSW